jgi:hypothetical protein
MRVIITDFPSVISSVERIFIRPIEGDLLYFHDVLRIYRIGCTSEM